jgi:phosphopantetheinyl transferase
MTSHASCEVYDYFESCSIDLTPSSARFGADVLYAPYSSDPDVARICSSILADSELLRAGRFVLEADKERFIQRRAFRRFCGVKMRNISLPLSQIVYEETDNGRPFIAGLPSFWFSFSSCNLGFIGASSLTHGIGIDLEDQSGKVEATALAQLFFSKNEASVIEQVSEADRMRLFFKFWCLKEAALKSIGEGLPFGLDVFQFELEPVLRVVEAPAERGESGHFFAFLIEKSNICAALVLRTLVYDSTGTNNVDGQVSHQG